MKLIPILLWVLVAVAVVVVPIGCAPDRPSTSDLPAAVERIEAATESFANTMLDLGVALRQGGFEDFRQALAPQLSAVPFPGETDAATSVQRWVLQHEAKISNAAEMTPREDFVLALETFFDRFSEIEDVRLKVKKSAVTGETIEADIALQVVGRDREGRRIWARGRAKVHAARSTADEPWIIDYFVLTSLDTLVAERDLLSEVAQPAGIARTDPPFLARRGPPFAAYGAAVGDLDNDGLLDLVVTSEDGNSVYRNLGNGRFEDVASQTLAGLVHGSVVAPLLVDVDNDGDLDIFLSVIGTQVLLENRLVPDGRFEFWDVSLEAGVARPAIGFSAVAGDVDGNGYPDIYVASYNRYGEVLPNRWDGATNGTPNLLFLNRGDGSFDEVGAEWGVADDRWSYAAAFADIDRDGDLDLYSTNDFGGGNALFVNQGGHFVDRAADLGVLDGGYGMGASFGDYDNDGDLDLHVTKMSSTAGRRILARLASAELPHRERLEELAVGNALYENRGDGSFADVSASAGPFAAGWAWGGGFIDLDNDGHEDLYTPNGFVSGTRLHDT